jgi:hypothetical protein
MRRKLSTIFALGCAAVAIASLLLWPRSKHTIDDVGYRRYFWSIGGAWALSASSVEGRLLIVQLRFNSLSRQGEESGFFFNSATGNSRLWSWGLASWGQMMDHGHHVLGIGIVHKAGIQYAGHTETIDGVMVLHWLVAAAAMPVPILWIARRRRERLRRERGLCMKCGYDLRGSVERCPECGAPATMPSPAIRGG